MKNILMKNLSKEEKSVTGLKSKVSIDYWNKRKMTYEPFLEPWEFGFKKTIKEGVDISIFNLES
jgi:hypothetical protein